MTQNNTTTSTQQPQPIPIDESSFLSAKELGAGVGALIAMAIAFSTWLSKHKNRDVKVDKAEGNFYTNLSSEQERLISRIKALEDSKDQCFSELVEMKSKLTTIVDLEEENKHLSEKLSERDDAIEKKDRQIDELISEIMKKDRYILELTERVHQLELKLAKIGKDG